MSISKGGTSKRGAPFRTTQFLLFQPRLRLCLKKVLLISITGKENHFTATILGKCEAVFLFSTAHERKGESMPSESRC